MTAANTHDSVKQVNETFYEALWKGVELYQPEAFNTWPLVSSLLDSGSVALEIGPGLRPRIPIRGNHFVDLSQTVVATLNKNGAIASSQDITSLKYSDHSFDLICAFDVIEHLPDDRAALNELRRLLKPEGTLLCSVPVHPDAWTQFDELVGHYRRYKPEDLEELLHSQGLTIRHSAGFGMKPQSRWLTSFGMWWLNNFPQKAFHYYNKFFFPYAMKRQETLDFQVGLCSVEEREGIIVSCGLSN